jgi:SAM-dependent methyltransferase
MRILSHQLNSKPYLKKYRKGYGTIYPEGNIIRFYEKFLKFEFNLDKKRNLNLLDLGCGNGIHPQYFASKGFNVFGIDMIPEAIEIAKKRLKKFKENFFCSTLNSNFSKLFDVRFDVIIANQSLYYLSNTDLKFALLELDRLLNHNGIVYISMMGTKSYYYKISKPALDGMRMVSLSGRLNEKTYINFTKGKIDLKAKFSQFHPYFIGYYDCTMREGSGYHYQFIGQKLNR